MLSNLDLDIAIDLTGGFGIDNLYLSKTCKNFIYNEINEEFYKIAKYNFQILECDNIKYLNP